MKKLSDLRNRNDAILIEGDSFLNERQFNVRGAPVVALPAGATKLVKEHYGYRIAFAGGQAFISTNNYGLEEWHSIGDIPVIRIRAIPLEKKTRVVNYYDPDTESGGVREEQYAVCPIHGAEHKLAEFSTNGWALCCREWIAAAIEETRLN